MILNPWLLVCTCTTQASMYDMYLAFQTSDQPTGLLTVLSVRSPGKGMVTVNKDPFGSYVRTRTCNSEPA